MVAVLGSASLSTDDIPERTRLICDVLADAPQSDRLAIRALGRVGVDPDDVCLPIAVDNAIFLVERPGGAYRLGHCLTHALTVLGADQLHVGIESTGEIQGVDPMNPVELGAPLHGTGPEVPEPTADTREGLGLLETGVHLCQRGLGKVLFGDIARNDHLPEDRALSVEQGSQRERYRDGKPVRPDDLRLEVPDMFTGSYPGDHLVDLVAEVRCKQDAHGATLYVPGRATKESFGVLAEVGDNGLVVAHHDRIVGQPDDRAEKRSRRGDR